MAKPEWGTKRICPSCGTRYYDLMRESVICPKCSTPYDPEAFLKARRSRPPLPVEKEVAPVDADAEADIEAVEDEEEAVPLAEGEEEEEEEEELIEDALGARRGRRRHGRGHRQCRRRGALIFRLLAPERVPKFAATSSRQAFSGP